MKAILFIALFFAFSGLAGGAEMTRSRFVEEGCFGNRSCLAAGKSGIAENWSIQEMILKMALETYSAGVASGRFEIGLTQATDIMRSSVVKVQTMSAAELNIAQVKPEYMGPAGAEKLKADFVLVRKWCDSKVTKYREMRCYYRQLNNLAAHKHVERSTP